jgi:hypothetical protein
MKKKIKCFLSLILIALTSAVCAENVSFTNQISNEQNAEIFDSAVNEEFVMCPAYKMDGNDAYWKIAIIYLGFKGFIGYSMQEYGRSALQVCLDLDEGPSSSGDFEGESEGLYKDWEGATLEEAYETVSMTDECFIWDKAEVNSACQPEFSWIGLHDPKGVGYWVETNRSIDLDLGIMTFDQGNEKPVWRCPKNREFIEWKDKKHAVKYHFSKTFNLQFTADVDENGMPFMLITIYDYAIWNNWI